jgi:hypothetical protein
VSLLLLRDLEWLALILALTVLSVMLLAATRRHSAPIDVEAEREP